MTTHPIPPPIRLREIAAASWSAVCAPSGDIERKIEVLQRAVYLTRRWLGEVEREMRAYLVWKREREEEQQKGKNGCGAEFTCEEKEGYEKAERGLCRLFTYLKTHTAKEERKRKDPRDLLLLCQMHGDFLAKVRNAEEEIRSLEGYRRYLTRCRTLNEGAAIEGKDGQWIWARLKASENEGSRSSRSGGRQAENTSARSARSSRRSGASLSNVTVLNLREAGHVSASSIQSIRTGEAKGEERKAKAGKSKTSRSTTLAVATSKQTNDRVESEIPTAKGGRKASESRPATSKERPKKRSKATPSSEPENSTSSRLKQPRSAGEEEAPQNPRTASSTKYAKSGEVKEWVCRTSERHRGATKSSIVDSPISSASMEALRAAL
jgi:hypothetical protein